MDIIRLIEKIYNCFEQNTCTIEEYERIEQEFNMLKRYFDCRELSTLYVNLLILKSLAQSNMLYE